MTQVYSRIDGVVNMFYVEEGAEVSEGERFMAIESMKTAFDILAPMTGRVRYKCHLGQVVHRNELLAEVV